MTFGVGVPVTRLEVVKVYSFEGFRARERDYVQFLEVEVELPGGGRGFLTIGGLYDLLLCGSRVTDDKAVTFGGETGSWELLLGARLRSLWMRGLGQGRLFCLLGVGVSIGRIRTVGLGGWGRGRRRRVGVGMVGFQRFWGMFRGSSWRVVR